MHSRDVVSYRRRQVRAVEASSFRSIAFADQFNVISSRRSRKQAAAAANLARRANQVAAANWRLCDSCELADSSRRRQLILIVSRRRSAGRATLGGRYELDLSLVGESSFVARALHS